MRIIALFFFTFTCCSYPAEYCYPVGSINQDEGSKIFFIHQVSSDNIELWSWDSITKATQKELPSYFNPAGFKLLPNKSGFSFVDNGIIRVKQFDKRSPKSLEIYEPVYDINVINWKDNDTCYFHAKYRNNYGIFQLTQRGQLDCIIKSKGTDNLYPQVVGDILFYIERSKTAGSPATYQIMTIPYPTIPALSKTQMIQRLMADDTTLVERGNKQDQSKVFDFNRQSIAFLKMVSPKEGFVLAHARNIEDDEPTLRCTYCHIKYNENQWSCSVLFSIELPRELLFDEDRRLYEGIVPLLPWADLFS